MVTREEIKEFAVLIPDKWESLHANEKKRVLDAVNENMNDIIKIAPETKEHFDRINATNRSRRGEGIALSEIRRILWNKYYGRDKNMVKSNAGFTPAQMNKFYAWIKENVSDWGLEAVHPLTTRALMYVFPELGKTDTERAFYAKQIVAKYNVKRK